MSPESMARWRDPLLVMLLAVLVSTGTIYDGVVNYDTPWLVVDNPILSTGSIAALPKILWGMDLGTRTQLGAEYLPVRDLTVLLDFALFGRAWAFHHAVNVAWYALGCGLFLEVARVILPGPGRALCAGALFAVHPVHIESVAWLASRKDVVSLALFMGAILFWLHRERGRGWLLASVGLTLLAYWAKNTAVVLPVLLGWITLVRQGPDPRRLLQLVPHALVIGAGLSITMGLGEMVGMYAEPRADSLVGLLQIDLQVVARYLGMLVAPFHLAVRYPEPVLLPWSATPVLAATALVGGLAMVGLACVRRLPPVAIGVGWFFVCLVPVMQLVPLQNLMADRYLLQPSAGLALALAALPLPLTARPAAAVVGALTVFFGATAWVQGLTWRGPVALWTHAVAVHPELPHNHRDLSGAYEGLGMLDESRAVLDRGLELHPGSPVLLQSLGMLHLERGELPEARRLLEAALAGDPELMRAGHNLTVTLIRQGRTDEAVEVGRRTVERHALYAEGWSSYGTALMGTGALSEAATAFEAALSINPALGDAACNRGGVAWLAEDLDGAERWWTRCLELVPGQPQATRGLQAVAQRRGAPGGPPAPR